MAAYGRSLDPRMSAQPRTPVSGPRMQGAAAQETPASRLPVSAVALIAAIGVLIASGAFAAGRLGYADSPWANRAYWLGQAFVLVPVAARLLSRRRLSNGDVLTLVVVLTIAEYILKICYSPLQFTFQDEFLHWRGTENLLLTGNPYTPNYGIPIGPHYPGLELATVALIQSTGLSIFTAGALLIGVAHLMFVCTLYWIFRTVGRSHRIGGIAVLIYYATPGFTSFNSMFVYETLALAFLGLTVMAALKVSTEESRGERISWYVIGILGIAGTVITHHVTSYMLTGALILVSVAGMITSSRQTAVRVGILAVISAGAVAAWIFLVAPDTLSYFQPTVQGMTQGLNALMAGGKSGGATGGDTSSSPIGDLLLEGIAVLILASLILIGAWHVWRRYKFQPWILAMALGSLFWFGLLAVRVGTPDGQELAGRAETYIDIPLSLLGALALTKLVNMRLLRRRASAAITVVAVGVLTLVFDGLANGWPPYWERLPGPFQVGGVERAVEPEEVQTADWTLSALGQGKNIAADIGIYPILAGYGDQNPLQAVDYLYTTPTYTPAIAAEAAAQDVQYVLVDRRMSTALSEQGSYFMGSSSSPTKPLPLADLTKYDHVPGVPRIYDSGDIVIYNLQGPGYAP